MKRIVCIGNVVLDQVYEVPSLPRAGMKTVADAYREGGGGPASTAAIAIAMLGGKASWWGRVGQDWAGDVLLAALARFGVDTSGAARIAGKRTIRAVVMVDPAGERSIVTPRPELPRDASLVPADDLSDAAVLLADPRWPEGAEVALERARACGLPRVLDADGGGAETLQRLARLSDHIVFSEQGIAELVGPGDPAAQLARAAERLSDVLAVTQGDCGSTWLLDGSLHHVPAFRVAVRDTTGCGDVFHGAYALGIAEGMHPLEAARFASAAAAAKARNGRGWDGMPDRHTIDTMLQETAR